MGGIGWKKGRGGDDVGGPTTPLWLGKTPKDGEFEKNLIIFSPQGITRFFFLNRGLTQTIFGIGEPRDFLEIIFHGAPGVFFKANIRGSNFFKGKGERMTRTGEVDCGGD